MFNIESIAVETQACIFFLYFEIDLSAALTSSRPKLTKTAHIHEDLYVLMHYSYTMTKTSMTTGEWSLLISFIWASLSCLERVGSEKFEMKIYLSSGVERTSDTLRQVNQRLKLQRWLDDDLWFYVLQDS